MTGPRQRHLNILARNRAEAREREARAAESVAASADLESLTEDLEQLLVTYDENGHLFGSSGAGAYFLAEHIVASDWFKRVTG